MNLREYRKQNAVAPLRPRLIEFGGWLMLLLSFAPDALAQFQFDSWTTENGLPQNSINDIRQTRNGYLWLSTNNGLTRFDGARFVVFDRSTEGIRTQRVRSLLEDSKGSLWVGTDDGMLIQYRDGKFRTYTVEDGLPYAQTSKIEEDDEGSLWITWHGAIIAVTKFDGERFVNYRPEDFAHGLRSDPAKRYPWWSQDSAGLHCLIKGRVRTYSFQGNLSQAQVIGVYADHYGNLWIQTSGAGVVKVTNGQIKHFTTREGLPSNQVVGSFLEDRKGNLWFSDYSPGSRVYRIKNGKPELIHALVRGWFYEDHEGSIWFGTLTGLYRLRELAITLLTERDGLSHNWVYPILQDRAGAIWIGSSGLNKYERSRFTHYRIGEGPLSDVITCIYEDKAGRLWIGTRSGLAYLKNGRFVKYEDESEFLKHVVRAIHEDRAGNLWFGTDKGLVKLKDGQFTGYTSKDGLSHDHVKALLEDRAGALWIGALHGLTRLKDGVFTAYTERDGFIGNQVRAIYEDGEGVLWIGTYDGGLYRLKAEHLTRYTTKEGLHDNGVFQILEDGAGNLWMGCNRGIYRVSRQELNDFAEGRARSITSVVYGTKDGLATLECNGGHQPSGLKTADGKLWFPTMGGVAIVDPKAVSINSAPLPVLIEEFRLAGELIDFSGGVEIPHDKNSFEVRYAAQSFIKPEYVRFKYRLEGLGQDWIEAGDRRTADFYHIPAGRYRFVVIAANSDGVWNTAGASVEIVVVPPPWRRWWFITLAVIASLSVVVLIYKRRVGHLREKHAMQQAFSRQLIESQEGERKRIASELHDGLGQNLLVVKSNALLGVNMAEDGSPVKEQFDGISATTSQALEEVRKIIHNLRPYHLDRLGLKEALEFMLEQVAAVSDIRFSAEIDAVDGVFSKEAETNLYRIAQESINNIIKHSGATEAKVTLKRDGRRVQLVIEDNGKGFVAEPGTSTESRRRGFGLTGVAERARMLGGKEEIHAVPGQGTTITVTVILQDERHEK
jgi:signal transduction histidine kinase/ligand-binding sensor domain-containing protein